MGEKSDLADVLLMSTARADSDQGVALVGYALIVVMVAIASLVTIKSVGQATSQSFEAVATTFPGGAVAEPVPELTPSEKWNQAKADYTASIKDAKKTKASELADAKGIYKAAIQENKSLSPKAAKKAANKVAKTKYNTAKSNAKTSYKSAVNTAKAAKNAAKAEYNATK